MYSIFIVLASYIFHCQTKTVHTGIKAIIITVSLLGLSGTLHAQDVDFGVRLGGGLSTLKGPHLSFDFSDVEDYSASKGKRRVFNVGIYGQVKTGKWFAIRTGLNYAQKGMVINETHRDLTYSVKKEEYFYKTVSKVQETYRLSYLQIPFLARVPMSPGARIQPLLFAGPTLGINLRSDERSVVESQIPEFEGGTYVDQIETSAMEFSMIFGAEVAYTISSGSELYLEIWADLGTSDIGPEDAPPGNAPIANLRNRVYCVGVGYTFSP